MPSSRLALSPRDCSSISPSPHPSLFGVPSGLGCAPFVPASRHRSLSRQKRCARHFPNFSWVPQKAIPSRNSSPSGRTCKTCQFSAWLRKQKQGLLRWLEHALIKRAIVAKRSHLENGTEPQEPQLSEAEK